MTDRERIAEALISCIHGADRAATAEEEMRAISHRIEAEVERLIRDAASRAWVMAQSGAFSPSPTLPDLFPLVTPKEERK